MTSELLQMAKNYPVITILGPRQAGKTTLAKNTFPNKPYLNLEAPDVRALAISDPRKFLEKLEDGAILDEIQTVPSLLSYIQVIVDEKNTEGIFILTGSHQLELHEAISQSLAGRTAILQLLPMSISELESSGISLTLNELLLTGGYPRIYHKMLDPTKTYRSYYQTYLEKDVRKLINIKDLSLFEKFIKVCASRVGCILNRESICNDVGVSSHTVENWLSVLEASFIIVRLQPYFENFGKRAIKSPKLFFTDVGLATYLLGIETHTQIERDPLRGNLVENLVFLELMKHRLNNGLDPRLYFFRDARGHEVDFIFQNGHNLIPIEVKAAKTFNKDFLKNLNFFKNTVKDRYINGYVIYSGTMEQEIHAFELLNYKNVTRCLENL